jgi:hypothetical protein
MRDVLRQTIGLWIYFVVEQMLILPIGYMVLHLCSVTLFIEFYAFVFLASCLLMLSRAWFSSKRRPWIIAALLLVSLLGATFFTHSTPLRLMLALLIILIFTRALGIVEFGSAGALFFTFIILGFIIHPIFIWFFLRSELFISAVPILSATGTISIFLGLFLLNRKQIHDTSFVTDHHLKIPVGLLKENRFLVALFFALIFILVLWETLGYILAIVWDVLWKVALFVLNLLLLPLRKIAELVNVSTNTTPPGQDAVEATPSFLGKAFDLFVKSVIVFILCYLLFVGTRYLIRNYKAMALSIYRKIK